MKKWGYSLIVLAICLAMGAYILLRDGKGEPLPVEGQGADFSYVDTEGNTVTLENTNGKARLLYFFFANCPDVCPPTTALLSQVQDELKAAGLFGDDVTFMSVTIDPERDTTEVLRDYADTFDADPAGWKFLRGEEQATAELADKYGIMVVKDNDGNFGHMNLIVLLDRKGQIRQWISANDYIIYGEDNLKPADMVKIIKKAL